MDELEHLLKRYQPSGPPRELRDRSLGVPVDGRRAVREWFLPAGAAAAAVVFYVLANGVQRDLLREAGHDNDAREAAITAMTVDLGGDGLARLQAEHVMNLTESAREAVLSAPLPFAGEVTIP